MAKTKEDLIFIKQTFEAIVDYEKSWKNSPINQSNSTSIPVNKILDYFGMETICELYGCTVIDDEIARRLIVKAFE
jgi:hypothetical protein